MGYHEYYNTYNYLDATANSIATGIVAIYLIGLLVYVLFYIISYIFKGIGMYTIAKRQGRENPWLAFIPFARTYLHGELAGEIRLKRKGIRNPGIWLLVMPFIFGALNVVFYFIFWIAGFRVLSSVFTSSAYGYGHHSAGLSTGGIMMIIIILLLWIAAAMIYGAVYKVLKALVNRQILEKFTSPNMAVAHAVFCFLIPLYESICLFVMRNRPYNPGMEPDLGRPFMQAPPPVVPPQGGPGADPYVNNGPVPDAPVQSAPIQDSPVQSTPMPETTVPCGEMSEQVETMVSENVDTQTAAAEQSVIYMAPPASEDTETSTEDSTKDLSGDSAQEPSQESSQDSELK